MFAHIRRQIRRTVATAAVGAGIVTAGVVAPHSPLGALPDAAAAARCSTATGGTKFYPGVDSSAVYNQTFRNGPSMNNYLHDYVPQGLAWWPNWKGTQDIFLVTMHHRDENSHLSLVYGMTAAGKRVGTAYLPKGAHVGSVKVYGKWMFVQQDNEVIRRYNLASVRRQFEKPGIPSLGPGTVLRPGGVKISFFDIYRGYLYAGFFNSDSRDWMMRYRISSSGRLHRDTAWGEVQIPKATQGLFVSADTFYFSTSTGRNYRSNLYVIRRGYSTNFEDTTYRCFRAPVLSEDLERVGSKLYLIFEGGADVYDGSTPSTNSNNKIKNLHVASMSTLHSMVW